MTVATDAIICFGIAFEEDTEFPWDDDKYDGDMDNWWLEVRGWQPSKQIYNEEGNYIDGVEPPQEDIDRYHHERTRFLEMNPYPVELVRHCHHKEAMYILAVPGRTMSARRGYPKTFTKHDIFVSSGEELNLLSFCQEFGLEYDEAPITVESIGLASWHLASYWG